MYVQRYTFTLERRRCRRVPEVYGTFRTAYLLLQYIHLVCAVAADAFSDNESDDRRKWRLDAKVRIMRLRKG